MLQWLKKFNNNKPKYRVVKITLGYIPQVFSPLYGSWVGVDKLGSTWTTIRAMTELCVVETRKDANLIIEEYAALTEDY